MDIDESPARAPGGTEFALQLIGELYAELDGLLFEEAAPRASALDVARRAARRGGARGGVLLLLIGAALTARRQLLAELDAPEPGVADSTAALEALAAGAGAQRSALAAHALRVERMLAAADGAGEPLTDMLGGLVVRFYAALGEDDHGRAHRALLELRSLLVHLDAAALTLEAHPAAGETLAVQRPDRFHDHFMLYTSLARSPEGSVGETPLAILGRDGKLSAVVTADTHPLEAAALAVRERIDGDERRREHTLARIRALLEFLDALRRKPSAAIGDASADSAVHLSLVLAAATTPLLVAHGFEFDALAQISRYNQALLRPPPPRAAARH